MKKGEDYTGIAIVYFCHDGKGNFIMSKRGKNARDEQGRWDIGGGALEFGSSIEDTLRQEIQEEYTTDILSYAFLGYRDVHRMHNGKPTHWVALDFTVHIDAQKVSNGEPHKFDEVKFFTFKSMPRTGAVHSQFPQFLTLYKKQLH